ncbi:MAG: DUF2975 domain-containing protein [Prevotella sp.]|nr:DUF2975 domain-containing protein [Prevotella sp.]
MDHKTKLVKIAKGCKIGCKVMYLLSCVATVVFVVLAIALSLTDAVATLTPTEVAILFTVLAMYAFLLIDFFWHTQKLFGIIASTGTPFNLPVIQRLKRIGWSSMIISVVPAVIGTILIQILVPNSELVCHVEVVGLIAGLVTLMLSVVFGYGKELQDKDDETI